ncbi:hypothetical protein B2J93_4845 [Marssonina coronariae]|uniref:Uncharacterized protein n=1 Tax=Diplocarpon coronariae TaxID=2795749 RepID=A0A218ZH22_9HELO|nr:hypothetical protein B2J93_4845 [Marssonina coronariae]
MPKPTIERDDASDRTLVLKGPTTPASSSATASSTLSILFAFAAGPSSSDLFAPIIAAAAPVPFASTIAATTIVSSFVSPAPIAAMPVLASAALASIALAIPPAFAFAIASIFASRPLAEGVPVGLF